MTKQNSGGSDAIATSIKANTDRAIQEALGLADQADKAGDAIVKECGEQHEIVRRGIAEVRTAIRAKMVEFSKAMQEYSDAVTLKNLAYIDSVHKAIEMVDVHINAVKDATGVVTKPDAIKLLGEKLKSDDRI
jgi:pyruvate carboxylase